MKNNRNSSAFKYPPAVAYILPFVVYSVVMAFYPNFDESYENDLNETVAQAATSETWLVYGTLGPADFARVGLVVYFRKVYLAAFPFKNFAMVVRGRRDRGRVVGGFGRSWELERSIASRLGLAEDMARPGFNPGTINDSLARALFLVTRFTVLVGVVPIVEELFLRGWVVKWIEEPNFGTEHWANGSGQLKDARHVGFIERQHLRRVDPSARSDRRVRVVWHGDFTGSPNRQRLGLHRGPRGDQRVAGRLCIVVQAVASLVVR